MNKLLLSGVSLVFWFCFSCVAMAQSSPGLLRMERVQRGEAVCVLVQGDGSYRLEKLFRAKTEMYTGTIDSLRVEQLRSMLANEQLRKLSQEDIHNPLISDTIDALQLDVWRDRGWQELRFFAPASRKLYKESLDPLLRWFQDLQKQPPAAVRVEGSPMRCQPMPVTELVTKTETSEAPKPETGVDRSAQYLFRAHSHHFYVGNVDSTCTIVFGDGRYHRERSDQSYLGERRDKVVDGKLNPEAIQQLLALLDSPELKNSPSIRDVGNSRPTQEGSVTEVSIPRQGGVQSLLFSTAFNVHNNSREVGGLSNLQYHVTDAKLIEPLSGWMKLYTDQHANAVEREAAGNNCVPTTASASAKSNP